MESEVSDQKNDVLEGMLSLYQEGTTYWVDDGSLVFLQEAAGPISWYC